MTQLRKVADLRRFTEIETTITQPIENALDIADKIAEKTKIRFTHTEMFEKLREKCEVNIVSV